MLAAWGFNTIAKFMGKDFLGCPLELQIYSSHVYKVTVEVDMLGNIVWICPLAPSTSTDVLIWDGYGRHPQEGKILILRWVAMMEPTKVGCM